MISESRRKKKGADISGRSELDLRRVASKQRGTYVHQVGDLCYELRGGSQERLQGVASRQYSYPRYINKQYEVNKYSKSGGNILVGGLDGLIFLSQLFLIPLWLGKLVDSTPRGTSLKPSS